MKILTREFYNRNTSLVATELLGKYLVHVVNKIEYVGRIVEVEAYLGQKDLACHASKGLTARTKIMFGPPGHAYIYMIYGLHHCMNIVTEEIGSPSAVLIRAVEPITNITERTQGPGLLCKAMRIDKSLNGHDLLSDQLYIASANTSNYKIVKRPRIGVDYAKNWANKLLRFYIKDNIFISKI